MKKYTVFILAVLAFATLGAANGAHNLTEARNLIQADTPCDQLTDDQLAGIGDYYMQLMHPGEMHEIMEQRLGGEGSATLEQAHINMAYRFYCGAAAPNLGLQPRNSWSDSMPMYGGSGYGGMMGPGMMYGSDMMYGNSYGFGNFYVGFVARTLLFLILIGLTGITYLKLVQLWRKTHNDEKDD